MPGPAPKRERRRRNAPVSGEWQAAPGTGWQHGKTPTPPRNIDRDARAAWKEWFASWPASFWRPEDVHSLRAAILLYDQMLTRPTASTATALARYLDAYGLTPAGRQARHWLPPENEKPQEEAPAAVSRYRGLKVVGG